MFRSPSICHIIMYCGVFHCKTHDADRDPTGYAQPTSLRKRLDNSKTVSIPNPKQYLLLCALFRKESMMSVRVGWSNPSWRLAMTNGDYKGRIFPSHPHTDMVFFFFFCSPTKYCNFIFKEHKNGSRKSRKLKCDMVTSS